MIRLGRNRPPEDSDEGAVWWAVRQRTCALRSADIRAFELWLEDQVNAAAWEALDRRIRHLDAFAAMPAIREMRAVALTSTEPRRRARSGRKLAVAALAASLVGALVLGSSQLIGLQRESEGASKRYATPVGGRRDVVLEDGSRIALNTGSAVEVYYSGDRRSVRLMRGQAFFDVAKDASRPFVVYARDRNITAVGTAFDVHLREGGGVDVLLVEGVVRVEPNRPSGLGRVLPLLSRTNLEAGQRLSTSPAVARPEITVGDVERETAWRRGVVILRDDKIADAVADMNRYTVSEILIEDPRIAELRISGVFPTAESGDFLDALEAFYPIRAQRVSPGAVTLRWREDAADDVG